MHCVICNHIEEQVEMLNDFKDNQIHTNSHLLKKIDELVESSEIFNNFKNYQIDEDRKILKRLNDFEMRLDSALCAIDINLTSHYDKINKIEKVFEEKLKLNEKIKQMEKLIRSNNEEPLCSAAFNNEKKKGLNFSEAMKFFINGRAIRLTAHGFEIKSIHPSGSYCFTFEDIMSNNWEVVD